jgi:hypothetical protein
MKVAILIHGQPRFTQSFDNFVASLDSCDQVDWFFYFWRENPVVIPGRIDVAPNWQTVDPAWALQKIKSKLPQHHNIISIELGDSPSERIAGQFLGLKLVDQLRQAHSEQYDIVIRSRPDLSFLDSTKPDYRAIAEQLAINPSLLITAGGAAFGQPYPIRDFIFITSSQAMTEFSKLSDLLPHYRSIGVDPGPESLYGYHAVVSGLKITPGDFLADVREGKETVGSMTVSKWGDWA